MTRRRSIFIFALVLILLVAGAIAAPHVLESRYNRVRTRPPYSAPAASIQFHQGLFVADLHADTLLWGRNLLRRSETGHIDIPRLQQANISLQVFSAVSTIPRNLNIASNTSHSDMVKYLSIAEHWPSRTWNSPKERALYQAAQLREFGLKSHGNLIVLRTRADLSSFVASNREHRVAAILAIEGAQPLEGKLENLDDLYAAGFRMMSPTHFTDTEIAGSASGHLKHGLSDLGRNWVHSMEAKNMLIDLAHASSLTLHEVTAIAAKPVIVSHTGVKGTCDNNRNLSDDELRAVAQTGGIVGIGYWEMATCGRDAGAVARAIQYAVKVVGVEHVALGSDFDGATTMPFDVTGIPLITDALRKANLSEHDIALIMGGNVVRVLSQNLPE